jgi:medium-chain acyl-[acyl-carrier-protein] hydrolase
VCFPFAGGSASTYRGWDHALPPTVEVHVVDLPGRIPRLAEAPRTDLTSLADDSAVALAPKLAGLPFAFFGHSMGAALAFETALRLQAKGQTPAHFFASARQSPALPWRRPKIAELPEAEFHAALARLGGTSRLVLADPEMMQIVMPSLRADFAAIESYQYRPGSKLTCNVSVIGGLEDPDVDQNDLLAWQDVTTGMALIEQHPGGHFYIDQQLPRVVDRIKTELQHAGVL